PPPQARPPPGYLRICQLDPCYPLSLSTCRNKQSLCRRSAATIRSVRALIRAPKSAQDMELPMLQVPLEIAFHNIESSDWAEQEIRTRVADLERLYGRLVSCRVRIDQRAKGLTGNHS